MHALLTITGKDLLLRLRDRSVLLYAIVAPLVLAGVLGLVFGADGGAPAPTLGVVPAEGQVADSVTDEVLPSLVASGVLADVDEFTDREVAAAAVRDGDVDAALVLPAGLDQAAVGGPDVGIEVLAGPDAPIDAAIARALADGVASEVDLVRRVVIAGEVATAELADVAAAAAMQPSVLTLVDVPVQARQLDQRTYLAAGMAVFFLLFGTGIAVTGLLEEERDGTMTRLRAAPVPSWAPLGAKALTGFVVGLVSLGLLALASTVALGASWGDPLGVALVIAAGAASATGVSVAIAGLVRSHEAAQQALGVVGTALGALGGAFFPVSGDDLLDLVSRATPHRWFLEGLTALAGDGTVADTLPSVVVMLAIGLAAAAVGLLGLRRRSA